MRCVSTERGVVKVYARYGVARCFDDWAIALSATRKWGNHFDANAILFFFFFFCWSKTRAIRVIKCCRASVSALQTYTKRRIRGEFKICGISSPRCYGSDGIAFRTVVASLSDKSQSRSDVTSLEIKVSTIKCKCENGRLERTRMSRDLVQHREIVSGWRIK